MAFAYFPLLLALKEEVMYLQMAPMAKVLHWAKVCLIGISI